METFIKFLSAIPGAVWGALIALCGVMYADWRNTRRGSQQNAFLAAESDKARLLLVRKEVYMLVPTILQEMQTRLIKLPGALEAKTEKDSAEPGSTLSKVSMVSITETAVLATRIATDYGLAHSRLTFKAQPYLDATADAENYSKAKAAARTERDRVFAELQKEFESGAPNKDRIAALEISRKHAASECDRLHALHVESAGQAVQHLHDFLREARDQIIPLVELGIKLMIRLRWELGQETDEEMYMREVKRGRDAFMQISEEAFDWLQTSILEEN